MSHGHPPSTGVPSANMRFNELLSSLPPASSVGGRRAQRSAAAVPGAPYNVTTGFGAASPSTAAPKSDTPTILSGQTKLNDDPHPSDHRHPPYQYPHPPHLQQPQPKSQLQPQQQQQGMRRPDSVITTSSIVSASDSASQSGETESVSGGGGDTARTVGPPTVYAISGLYGGGHASSHHKAPQNSSAAEAVVSSASVATPTSTATTDVTMHAIKPAKVVQLSTMTHRRQASHPGNFPLGGGVVTTSTTGGCPAPTAAGAQGSCLWPPTRNVVNGHRRSNSYGHHRALTGTASLGTGTNMPLNLGAVHHRRAGSSVIETLQTLSCTGADAERRPEDSIAQFLENLKKEQQEKIEKQELHEMQDELEDLRDCGLSACRPKVIQPCANIKVFVFLLSVLVTLQQALSSGYLNSVITTIEKRYEIPSSISGIIASMYEIGNVGTVIFVSYLGSRRHIPAWIGMGVLIMGLGSITFSLPHFLSGNYMVHGDMNNSVDNICRSGLPQHGVGGVGGAAGIGVGGVGQARSTDDIILEQLPGLDKITSLTKDLSVPPLGPHNNNYNRESNCIESAKQSSAMPIVVFMVAQLLLGVGGSPLFTLGTTYIDNHVKRDDSSMYIGIMYSMCAFGPVCGFLLGAYLLSFHVDTFAIDVDGLGMDSSDRHWIGMWWGGFLICGASLITISIPFFFFPKELKKDKVKVYIDEKYHHASDPSIRPNKHKKDSSLGRNVTSGDMMCSAPPASSSNAAAANLTSSAVAVDKDPADDRYGKDIKDIPRSTWKLLTNKIYMITCLGACMELIIVSGFIVFLPKYLETQFNLGKSMASMFTGGIAIPGACIGIFLGGYILKRLQLRPKGAVQLVIFFNLLCLGCYSLLFFFGCDNMKMAGATMPYFNSNQSEPFTINLTASCNFGCECDMNDVQPVCGANGITYFSPCHAGCTSSGAGPNSDNYTDCACVINSYEDPFSSATPLKGLHRGHADHFAEVTMVPVATAGPCYTQCQMIMPFMVLLFFMTLVVAVTQMPVLMVVLRSVEEEEKAFALGIQFVIFRIFGYIPSPILFGNVIDSTCLLWKSTCEGEEGGRCLMYDIELFRYKYVGVCCFIKICSVIIFLVDWWLIRSRQQSEKKEAALTVGEIVNSIISLDKLFEPDGPLWHHVADVEDGSKALSGSSKELELIQQQLAPAIVSVPGTGGAGADRLEPPSPSKPATEFSACLERPHVM